MARVKKGEVVPNVEVKRLTKDQKEILISMTISPLKDAEGKIIGASRICKDITHLKKAEERLIMAERLSSLGELTAGVAHELRNPLAGIKINTQVLSRKQDLSEMERRLLESTQEGIEKIQKIVDDMLHFAKPRASHFKEEAINEVVDKSLAILQARFKKGNISAVFDRGEGLPSVRIDIHQIQQVFINLMLNAIQAMEKRGNIDDSDLSGERGNRWGRNQGHRRGDSFALSEKGLRSLFYNKIGRHRPRPLDQPQDFGEPRGHH